MLRRVVPAGLGIALLLLVGACNGGPDSPISPSPVALLTIDDIALSVDAAGVAGLRRDGPAPAANGGPDVDAFGNRSIVNGGTLAVELAASAPFTRAYMAVTVPTEGVDTSTPGLVEGYYEIPLASSQTTAALLLSFPQDIALGEFDLAFAVAAPDGTIGPYVTLTVTVIQVGTGDVQVTLSWDTDSDVDLHVIAPTGEEVYYGQDQVASGGRLDLDSNAGCSIDGVRNENITWPIGQAPTGLYTVRVNYWSNCGVQQTNYTVRINNGGNVQVVSGTFTGTGTEGGAGDGLTVATFTRSSGTATSSLPITAPGWQATRSLTTKGTKP